VHSASGCWAGGVQTLVCRQGRTGVQAREDGCAGKGGRAKNACEKSALERTWCSQRQAVSFKSVLQFTWTYQSTVRAGGGEAGAGALMMPQGSRARLQRTEAGCACFPLQCHLWQKSCGSKPGCQTILASAAHCQQAGARKGQGWLTDRSHARAPFMHPAHSVQPQPGPL